MFCFTPKLCHLLIQTISPSTHSSVLHCPFRLLLPSCFPLLFLLLYPFFVFFLFLSFLLSTPSAFFSSSHSFCFCFFSLISFIHYCCCFSSIFPFFLPLPVLSSSSLCLYSVSYLSFHSSSSCLTTSPSIIFPYLFFIPVFHSSSPA